MNSLPTYRAVKCPCGHRACTSWHVDPVARVQGVNFTREEAEAVAGLLNSLERTKEKKANGR